MSVPPLLPNPPQNPQPESTEAMNTDNAQPCTPVRLYRTDRPESDLETLSRNMQNQTEEA